MGTQSKAGDRSHPHYLHPHRVEGWVERALQSSGLALNELDRRRVIAALMSRPHLLLSGPAGIGKGQFIRALAVEMVDHPTEFLCITQGHPWWASNTGDVATYVRMQTTLNEWRVQLFVSRAMASAPDATPYVICVERLGPPELEWYADWLLPRIRHANSLTHALRLVRFIGSYDTPTLPRLSDQARALIAQVHLAASAPER
ncbi:MAG: hypothetical protein Kow0047_05740 [Anaerolineae bacterium]